MKSHKCRLRYIASVTVTKNLLPSIKNVSTTLILTSWCGKFPFFRSEREREINVLCNDALNTFYLRLYGVRHMVKNYSDSERGNALPPHRLLFPISTKGSFICIIPQTG